MEGWIKLYRKLDEWEWADNPGMVTLFVRLLILASPSGGVWHGIGYQKGQLITSVDELRKKTGLSTQQVRTCLNRLKSTNEITIKSTNKYTIVTICKYESYQANINDDNKQNNKQSNNQLTNNQQTNNKQITNNNNKNVKNVKNIEKEINKEKDATVVATNEQKLMARKDVFLAELSLYIGMYGEQTVAAFADYWTEPNRTYTKMRFEMQPTWDTARRLATWARREKPAQQTTSGNGKLAPKEALRRMVNGINNKQTTINL